MVSPPLLEEILSTLSRPIFELDQKDIDRLKNFVNLHAHILQPLESVDVCRDASDNAILECALAGRVDAIITGDKDLLVLDPFHGIPIVSPKAFINRFLA